MNTPSNPPGTWEVLVAGVALVVAASTLVTDFTGFFTLGAGGCLRFLYHAPV